LTTKVIVTGATGFIGSKLCSKLCKKKEYSITKVTRSKNSKKEFFHVDCYKQTPVGDVLIHLGEDSDRARVNKMGDSYLQTTGSTMDSLLEKSYKKIIYCSSSVVYGDQGIEPFSENMPTYKDDIYSMTKLKNEDKVLMMGEVGMVIRFSNVIGSKMSKKNVFSDILKQILNNESKPVTMRDTNPVRDFILVDDAVDAIIRLMQKEAYGVFNVGSGVPTSINQLVRITLNAAKQNDRKISSNFKKLKYSYNVLNIDKIKKVTNWQPKFTLPKSVDKIITSL